MRNSLAKEPYMTAKSAKAELWNEEPDRTEQAFRALSAAFGRRIRSLTTSRVVREGPLTLLRVELDRVRRDDPVAAKKAVAGSSIVSIGIFRLEIDMLPKLASVAADAPCNRGPYDQGPANDARKREIVKALRTNEATGLLLHDNIYGRSIEILGREKGRWLLRTVFANGLRDRARAGREIEAYVMEGWWTA